MYNKNLMSVYNVSLKKSTKKATKKVQNSKLLLRLSPSVKILKACFKGFKHLNI